MEVRVELARILIREADEAHIIELREADGQRSFPIVIGLTEAMAIDRRVLGRQPPRPQTHELLADIVEQLGYHLEKVIINDLRNHTFYARLYLRKDDEVVDIDCRPSDALALVAATDVPIFVEDHVLEEVSRAE